MNVNRRERSPGSANDQSSNSNAGPSHTLKLPKERLCGKACILAQLQYQKYPLSRLAAVQNNLITSNQILRADSLLQIVRRFQRPLDHGPSSFTQINQPNHIGLSQPELLQETTYTTSTYDFSFAWEIEGYSSCYQKTGECIDSPIFSSHNLDGTRWYLSLYPRGVDENHKDYVSFYWRRCEDDYGDKDVVGDYTVQLYADNGNSPLLTLFDIDVRFDKSNSFGWGFAKFLKIKNLEDDIKTWNTDTIKIVFRLNINEMKERVFTACCANTKISVTEQSFIFGVAFPDNEFWYISEKIYYSDTIQFEITLTAHNDDILLSVHKISLDGEESIHKTVYFTICFLHPSGMRYYHQCYVFSTETDSWEVPFVKKGELQKDFANAMADLKCIGEFINREVSSKLQRYIPGKVKEKFSLKRDNHSSLKQDLHNMFNSKKHCNIDLRLDNVTIPAHKSVLAARSPVFRAMFDQDMTESRTGVVNITDIDPEILDLFLEFMYTDSITTINDVSALQLLLVAEKYQVPTLKEMCCSFLMTSLTTANVCEVMRVAHMIRHDVLKTSTLAYIKDNRKKILLSSKWSLWVKDNVELASEIVCNLSADIAEI